MPQSLTLIATLAAAVLLCFALRRAAWQRLADREAQAVFGLAIVALVAMRLMRVELLPGMSVHLLGASIVALMFGWRLALLATALAVGLVAVVQGSQWWPAALEFWISAALPVLWTTAALDWAQRKLPLHFFVYVFVNAFAAGALALAWVQLSRWGMLLALGVPASERLHDSLLLTIPAMMFAEGFTTGALLTLFVAYRPQWVATFHDADYLGS